jgi:DNA repair photolyase
MQEFDSFITHTDRKYNTWCKYNKRLDTYGCGCSHDCGYCYAKALLNFRGNWNAQNPRVAYITEIEKEISKLSKSEVIRLGGMTDCFQPYEIRERVTYGTIKILNQYRINHIITTKSALVADPGYLKIYDPEIAHFQISISCTSDERAAKYEKCSLVTERIKAAEKLHEMGFDVSLRLSPFLYQFTDEKILNNIKCKKILVEFLKVNHWVAKNFDYDYSLHTLHYGGHLNLELETKLKALKMIGGFEQCSVGEFVPDHYEYFRLKYNYNPLDCCNIDKRYVGCDSEQMKLELKDEDARAENQGSRPNFVQQPQYAIAAGN